MIESSKNEEGAKAWLENEELEAFENKLRPRDFSGYIGQDQVKTNLQIAIEAAEKRGDRLDHVLLHGAPGLGKTTLATIIANSAKVNIKITSGPALEKPGDIAAIVSNLKDGDILFIDEIHRLKSSVEEILYSAMEDFAIDIILGKGPSARNMRIQLPQFTLVGATTKISMLSSPLRDRFGSIFKLQFYEEKDIQQIILRSAKILEVAIDKQCAAILAKSCRNTPRVANRLLKRVRDYAEVKHSSIVDEIVLQKSLGALGIDAIGLEASDREILMTIIDKFRGGPVGLGTLAAAISEETATIEDVYEPFLIQMGFLERTPRGRMVTERAYKHLNLTRQT